MVGGGATRVGPSPSRRPEGEGAPACLAAGRAVTGRQLMTVIWVAAFCSQLESWLLRA